MRWAQQHSVCQDKERDGADTLLMTATFAVGGDDNGGDGDDFNDSEAIVEAVQKALNEYNGSYFVELWASAPAPLPLRPPTTGYDMLGNITDELWDEKAPQLMREYGLVQQTNILNERDVAELRQMVDGAIANVEALLAKHRPEINVGKDPFIFKEIASRNLERFDLRIPDATEYVKRCILVNAKVQSLLRQSLGEPEEVDFDVGVVYSRPAESSQQAAQWQHRAVQPTSGGVYGRTG